MKNKKLLSNSQNFKNLIKDFSQSFVSLLAQVPGAARSRFIAILGFVLLSMAPVAAQNTTSKTGQNFHQKLETEQKDRYFFFTKSLDAYQKVIDQYRQTKKEDLTQDQMDLVKQALFGLIELNNLKQEYRLEKHFVIQTKQSVTELLNEIENFALSPRDKAHLQFLKVFVLAGEGSISKARAQLGSLLFNKDNNEAKQSILEGMASDKNPNFTLGQAEALLKLFYYQLQGYSGEFASSIDQLQKLKEANLSDTLIVNKVNEALLEMNDIASNERTFRANHDEYTKHLNEYEKWKAYKDLAGSRDPFSFSVNSGYYAKDYRSQVNFKVADNTLTGKADDHSKEQGIYVGAQAKYDFYRAGLFDFFVNGQARFFNAFNGDKKRDLQLIKPLKDSAQNDYLQPVNYNELNAKTLNALSNFDMALGLGMIWGDQNYPRFLRAAAVNVQYALSRRPSQDRIDLTAAENNGVNQPQVKHVSYNFINAESKFYFYAWILPFALTTQYQYMNAQEVDRANVESKSNFIDPVTGAQSIGSSYGKAILKDYEYHRFNGLLTIDLPWNFQIYSGAKITNISPQIPIGVIYNHYFSKVPLLDLIVDVPGFFRAEAEYSILSDYKNFLSRAGIKMGVILDKAHEISVNLERNQTFMKSWSGAQTEGQEYYVGLSYTYAPKTPWKR